MKLVVLWLALSVPTADDYTQMLRWEFSSEAVPVPEGGIRFERDGATWFLETGRLYWMRPISNGRVTGLAFEGEGRFTMDVPDPVELSQLRRFAEEPELTRVDVPFEELVLRTSEELPSESVGNTFRRHSLARKRHDMWLERRSLDVDARIVAALREPGDAYFRAEMKTSDWDWITYELDSMRTEEIRLIRQHTLYPEVWVSLDKPADRRPDGRPSGTRDNVADLKHIDVVADLTKSGGNVPVGRSRVRPRKGKFLVDIDVVATVEGVSALTFDLDPRAEVHGVVDADGADVAFVRDHVGDRSGYLDDEIYDDQIVLLLEAPLEQGEAYTYRFDYELKITGFARGNVWYPTLRENHLDRHTARLELTTDKKSRAHSMGRLVDEREDGKTRTTTWSVGTETTMITFVSTKLHDEEHVTLDGVPDVVAVAPEFGFLGGRVEALCEDVAHAVSFFQTLLGSDLPGDRLFVTSIPAGHGQSFDGFLHLPESTLFGERPGKTELLRAHEVAHQWWGHEVRWRTYRDLWLSEAFAEYSAMMFVEASVDDGEKYFREILQAYQQMLRGSLRGAMSKFTRPGLIEMNPRHRARLGPIGVGSRAGTKDIPAGYFLQVYHKGPLVIHMLRELLRERTGSDDVFETILQEFIRAHRGGLAGTEDFVRVVEANADGDWKAFFDQWIDQTEFPTYHYRYEIGRTPDEDGEYALTLELEQSGTQHAFPMAIPVKLELENGSDARFSVIVEVGREIMPRSLPARVKKIELDPDEILLATFKER